MPSLSEAEEHLRVIRSLMERATVYRAIAAPAAFIGGLLAFSASFVCGNWSVLPFREIFPGRWSGGPGELQGDPDVSRFLPCWLTVLAITVGVNLLCLRRDAHRRNAPFFSAGMRLAMRALLPSYLVASCWTLIFAKTPEMYVPMWILCHGLALLATAHFAPRSLVYLGWAFLVSGLLSSSVLLRGLGGVRPRSILTAEAWLACTFGLLHIAYAIAVWVRKPEQVELEHPTPA